MLLAVREFLVFERDHFVPSRLRPRWPAKRGRSGTQGRRWQWRRYLLHLDRRAQVVSTGTARYKILGDDATRVMGGDPVMMARHGLLHGTPAHRLPLEWRRRRGQGQATVMAAGAAIGRVVDVIVERRRWQQRYFLLRGR